MEVVTDKPKRVSAHAVSTKPRCRAKSKQSGERCRAFPLMGKTLCKKHGGLTEKVSATHLVTHGGTRKYFHVDELPEIIQRARALDTPEGRTEAIKRNYAVIEHRRDKIPADDEYTEVAIKAAKSLREDVALLEDLEREETAPQLPTFVIATGDAAQQTFEARTSEGHCTIELVRGRPYMLDPETGALWPAQKRTDDETGAELYERVLVAKAE